MKQGRRCPEAPSDFYDGLPFPDHEEEIVRLSGIGKKACF
jgi:hypothetical protein